MLKNKLTIFLSIIAVILVLVIVFQGDKETYDASSGPKIIGNANSKVKMIEYSEFLCPYCGAYSGKNIELVNYMKITNPGWTPAFPKIKEEYIDTGKISYEFRHTIVHPEAVSAGVGAECAGEQGKFFEMHDKLFEYQKSLSDNKIKSIAEELNLNTTMFNDCFNNKKYLNVVINETNAAKAKGITSTPSFEINGRIISGALPFDNFKEIIEAELKK